MSFMDKAKDKASELAEKAKDVASDVKEKASDLADKARDKLGKDDDSAVSDTASRGPVTADEVYTTGGTVTDKAGAGDTASNKGGAFDTISDKVEDVIPGDSDKDGH